MSEEVDFHREPLSACLMNEAEWERLILHLEEWVRDRGLGEGDKEVCWLALDLMEHIDDLVRTRNIVQIQEDDWHLRGTHFVWTVTCQKDEVGAVRKARSMGYTHYQRGDKVGPLKEWRSSDEEY